MNDSDRGHVVRIFVRAVLGTKVGESAQAVVADVTTKALHGISIHHQGEFQHNRDSVVRIFVDLSCKL